MLIQHVCGVRLKNFRPREVQGFVLKSTAGGPGCYYRLINPHGPSVSPLNLSQGILTCQPGHCAQSLLRASLGLCVVTPPSSSQYWVDSCRGGQWTVFSAHEQCRVTSQRGCQVQKYLCALKKGLSGRNQNTQKTLGDISFFLVCVREAWGYFSRLPHQRLQSISSPRQRYEMGKNKWHFEIIGREPAKSNHNPPKSSSRSK